MYISHISPITNDPPITIHNIPITSQYNTLSLEWRRTRSWRENGREKWTRLRKLFSLILTNFLLSFFPYRKTKKFTNEGRERERKGIWSGLDDHDHDCHDGRHDDDDEEEDNGNDVVLVVWYGAAGRVGNGKCIKRRSRENFVRASSFSSWFSVELAGTKEGASPLSSFEQRQWEKSGKWSYRKCVLVHAQE